MGTIFLHEIAGTAILLLLGVGVVANVVLTKTKGNGGGWLLISLAGGWASSRASTSLPRPVRT